MSRVLGMLLVLTVFFGCDSEPKVNSEITKIEADVRVIRFDLEFYNAVPSDLHKLKSDYSYMFPKAINDTVWIQKMENDQERFLFEQSDSIFKDFELVESEIHSLFQHIKYNYPNFNEPTVVTHISNLDYDYPVIYADSLLFVSLDMFLGRNHEVYSSFPKYIAQNYNKENLIIAISSSVFQAFYRLPKSRIFINKMINEGKLLYALDETLPLVEDYLKIGYSKEKLDWALESEVDIWKYFMENELLYSADASLSARFLDVAPFSKFYLASDNDSPGSIGKWIGWQIVRSYMTNNDVTLQQLMILAPEDIFRQSKYKPRK